MSKQNQDIYSKDFYQQCKDTLKTRVSKPRFNHCKGVAKTAKKLASVYGCDPALAKLAGILHDWDKGYTDDEIRARVKDLNLDVDDYALKHMPYALHGITAAAELARIYPDLPECVISAVRNHTLGSTSMTDMDMIIYIADCIEPGRTGASVERIRAQVGKVSLEDLFFLTCGLWAKKIIDRKMMLHPDTLVVYNHYAQRYRERKPRKRKGKK